ncbi:hypothetical protein [Chitinophaga skermanii]|uniref:hypothetical protein n=1 Tax=Chitinophaga skermanii TaxID=331697 RepID=UPI00131472DA|nr:hypothetical protein [Chitinophaga skermanii]
MQKTVESRYQNRQKAALSGTIRHFPAESGINRQKPVISGKKRLKAAQTGTAFFFFTT